MSEGQTEARKIAVAHHCEGGGHASRMLAVVQELERTGYDVVIAGGGPGVKFVEKNGYDEFEPSTVDFIRSYQQDGGLLTLLRDSSSAMVERIGQYRTWLSEESPAFFVTDDILAAIAATITSQRYVYISHDPAGFYTDRLERFGAWFRNRLARSTTERFLLPKVWTGKPTIPGTEEIPPIAPRTADVARSIDVLAVPSEYSVVPRKLQRALESRGRDVTMVGGDDWEVEPSLQPAIAGAEVVVCSGYSTVMEAAVAGTPCIILPATSEQRGVVDAVTDLVGFYRADGVDDVMARIDDVEQPERRENGTGRVAEVVTRHLPTTSTG